MIRKSLKHGVALTALAVTLGLPLSVAGQEQPGGASYPTNTTRPRPRPSAPPPRSGDVIVTPRPSEPPKHVGFITRVKVAVGAVFSVTVAEAEAVQPFESVTVTV